MSVALANCKAETQTLDQLLEDILLPCYRLLHNPDFQRLEPFPLRKHGEPRVRVDILKIVAETENMESMVQNLLTNGQEYLSRTKASGQGERPVGRGGESSSKAAGSQVKDTAKATVGYPALPSAAAPAPGPADLQAGNFAAAAASPPETAAQRRERQVRSLKEDADKTSQFKPSQVPGAAPWEVVLPEQVSITSFIEPWERQAKAWKYLMFYSRNCGRTKLCADIMSYMTAGMARHVDTTLSESMDLVKTTSKTAIASSTTETPPPAPAGPYRDYDARSRAPASALELAQQEETLLVEFPGTESPKTEGLQFGKEGFSLMDAP
ncbi:hypothetical protein SLS62_009602 [Diatrype stigma]|uniref:Uncharacterized protein n=1 Tax=Diatrype stigma TaxID=117547 RepID=A0AAN9UD40_9PEZI